MKHLNLSVLFLFLTTIKYALAQNAGSRHDAACEYLNNRIYCFGGSSVIAKYVSASNNMAMLDLLKYSGYSTSELNNGWVFISTNSDFVVQARGSPQHMRLSDGNSMVISGGFTNTVNLRLNYQTIVFNANNFTWSSFPHFSDLNFTRQIYGAASVYVPDYGIGFYGGQEDEYVKDWTSPEINNISAYVNEESRRRYIGYTKLTFFNPLNATNIWSEYHLSLNRMRNFYSYQTSVFDKNRNRILFLGGRYQNPAKTFFLRSLSSAPYFDLDKGTWSVQNFNGSTPSVRKYHTATVVGSNQDYALLYGGQNSENEQFWAVSDYCYTLNMAENSWTLQTFSGPSNTVDFTRTRHSAILVDDNTLFIVYGITQIGASANSMLILDVSNPLAVSLKNDYTHPLGSSLSSISAPTTTTIALESTQNIKAGPDEKADNNDSNLKDEVDNFSTETKSNKKIGIAVGCTAGGVIIIGAFLFFFWKKKRSDKYRREIEELERRRCEIEDLQKMAYVKEEPMLVNWDEIDKELAVSPTKHAGSHYTYSPQLSEQTTTVRSGSVTNFSSPTFTRQEMNNNRSDDIEQYNYSTSTRQQASIVQNNNAMSYGIPDAIDDNINNVNHIQKIQKPDGGL